MLLSGFRKCTILAPSMSFTSASLKSEGESATKHGTRSDFWLLLRLPCFDKDGGTSVFSTSNNLTAFSSLTCREIELA